MLTTMTDLPNHVLGVEASGTVDAEDYKNVLVPALEKRLSKHKQVRLLYSLGADFNTFTSGAAWEDAKIGMKHLTSFERIAVVTDLPAIKSAVHAMGFALPAEVHVYANAELADAKSWIAEAPSPGHLSFQLLKNEGILILEPKGELEAADFARVGAELDPYIEAAGHLNGLMIVSEHFPGWNDFAALSTHFRFAREHQQKIRRIALVTQDRLVSALPRFASRFVEAKVKVFSIDAQDAAKSWLAGV